MEHWRARLHDSIETWKFLQYAFFSQWNALRRLRRQRGIRIMGDLPIYVAHDSADVWANPQYFQLDAAGNPLLVAGVPPDYFSATGQLWGNPTYAWDVLERDGYRWWLDRFRAVLQMVDLVRLDHFRGFEAYWEVRSRRGTTAEHGRWVKGPGSKLFRVAREALGDLPLVAENLGVITPEVEAIRDEFGFPGMSILQFAFGNDPQGPGFRPHNYPRELVAYTGTHDCDTTVGWWTSEGRGEDTRTSADLLRERDFTRRYLNTDGTQIHWVSIRALLSSVADTVLVPLQDVLGLASEARMNQPATMGNNWRWRFSSEMLTPDWLPNCAASSTSTIEVPVESPSWPAPIRQRAGGLPAVRRRRAPEQPHPWLFRFRRKIHRPRTSRPPWQVPAPIRPRNPFAALSVQLYDLQPGFDALPAEAPAGSPAKAPAEGKEAVYQRMWQILSGRERDSKYARLSLEQRQAIVGILRDTRKGLPEYFRAEALAT